MKPQQQTLPHVLRIPLRGCADTLVVILQGRAMQPPEGLLQLRGLVREPDGAWIAAAQAGNGAWGLLEMGDACRWRAEPVLENLFGLSDDGLARFSQQGRWGYLDAQGRVAIEPRFEAARPFVDGRAAVQTASNEWRMIDSQGRFVGKESFFELWALQPGGWARAMHWPILARMMRKPRGTGFVDRDGQWMIEPRFYMVKPFGPDGVAPAMRDEKLWGLIDRRGEWVMEPRYSSIQPFNASGLAHFSDDSDGWNIRDGYLDARGDVVYLGGSYLSEDMACGIAATTYDGSSYVQADGQLLPAPLLSYGTNFQANGGYAVVRTGRESRDDPMPAWGLLRSDGSFVALPEDLLEPVTDGEGWVPEGVPENSVPSVAFLTASGGVAWIDPAGRIVWRVRYDERHMVLTDSQGNVLWRSADGGRARAPALFFNAPLEDHLEDGLRSLEEAGPAAEAMLAEVEQRLHRYAAGEELEWATEGDEEEDGEDEQEENGEAGGQDTQARRTVVERRVMRAYLNEYHNGPYAFLWSRYTDQAQEALQKVCQALQQRFGEPEPDPETWVPLQRFGNRVFAWPVSMQRALPGDDGGLPGSHECWIVLYALHDAGDGDTWAELHLLACPGIDAMQLALRERERHRHGGARSSSGSAESA